MRHAAGEHSTNVALLQTTTRLGKIGRIHTASTASAFPRGVRAAPRTRRRHTTRRLATPCQPSYTLALFCETESSAGSARPRSHAIALSPTPTTSTIAVVAPRTALPPRQLDVGGGPGPRQPPRFLAAHARSHAHDTLQHSGSDWTVVPCNGFCELPRSSCIVTSLRLSLLHHPRRRRDAPSCRSNPYHAKLPCMQLA